MFIDKLLRFDFISADSLTIIITVFALSTVFMILEDEIWQLRVAVFCLMLAPTFFLNRKWLLIGIILLFVGFIFLHINSSQKMKKGG